MINRVVVQTSTRSLLQRVGISQSKVVDHTSSLKTLVTSRLYSTYNININNNNNRIRWSTTPITYIRHYSHTSAAAKAAKQCWQCNISVLSKDFFCPVCNVVQVPSEKIDVFEIFSLAPSYHVDQKDLSHRFKNLQKKLHPDLFNQLSQREQSLSKDQATLLNRAYNILRSPFLRAEYMLNEKGFDIDGVTDVDPEVLAEVLEIREAIDEASSDEEAIKKLAHENRAKMNVCEEELVNIFKQERYPEALNKTIYLRYMTQSDNSLSTSASVASPWLIIISPLCIIITLALFVSPFKTMRRVALTGVGQLAGVQFISQTLNNYNWVAYSIVSSNASIFIVNSIGAALSTYYVYIYWTCLKNPKLEKDYRWKCQMALAIFVGTLFYTWSGATHTIRQDRLGLVSSIVLVLNSAAPLEKIKEVLETRSSEGMVLEISFTALLCSCSWTIMGLLITDVYVYLPNVLSGILAFIQCSLIFMYPKVQQTLSSNNDVVNVA
ncbi:hypothetical protein SAMD00019534_039740, partial [Acytostelium subglobosum LB1]|uniref:hypothetical protein n=1 Tax=Acytostelium subglobosum LB1 TaxID=1410327 RepID=UPI00064519F1